MRLALRVARWSRPMRGAPRIGSRAPLTTREGLLVALGRDGRWGVGEAAPLPGLSTESPADVERALGHALDPTAQLPSSLALALEVARLELASHDAAPPSVGTALLASEAARPDAGSAGACVKVKVGRRPLAVECAQVAAFAAAGVRLRLDGNRLLDREAARALVAAAGDALDFLEEPGPGLDAASLGVPVALDESIDEACALLRPECDDAELEQALRGHGEAPVWVIKPTIVGPHRTRQLARLAAREGRTVVLSSAYDGSVGRRGLVRMATTLGLSSVVHGLGTGGLLVPDLEASPGPVLIESGGLVTVGAPLSPASFPDLDWREVFP